MERGSHARIVHISRWEAAVVFLAFVLHAAAFTLYTGQIWEDYFITFRFSQNLAEGRGLTHNGVDRVHGFTSPLGTLLPALFHWASGAKSYEPALFAYRIVSILAYAASATVVFVFLASQHRHGRLTAWLFAFLFLFDAKSVAFSTNGMETGFMLLFTALGFVLSQLAGPRIWLATGAVWAGLLWTRPDGCIYIAVFALLQLLQPGPTLIARIRDIARQSALTAVLYLPWFLFAWSYFGSPVPHTIVAKAAHLPHTPQTFSQVVTFVLEAPFDAILGPIGRVFGYDDWPFGVPVALSLLGLFISLIWLLPFVNRIGRMASFACMILLLYLMQAPLYSWYFPPVAMLSLVGLASFLVGASGMSIAWIRIALRLSLLSVLLLLAYLDMQCFSYSRLQQDWVERNNRSRIASWLRDNALPGDSVYLECLGYIGYFSGLEMWDYPGLATPKVVEAWKCDRASGSIEHGFSAAFWAVNPKWLVARPDEVEMIRIYHPDFDEHYDLAREFNVEAEIEEQRPFPGANWMLYDSTFRVYRRKNISGDPQVPKH